MISVIVPIYQIEEYLPRCIETIRNQTYRDLEIILVDDGSTDKSGKICDEFAEHDKRIKVIHKENGGLVSARIAGIKAASGSYVTYVDGDDWIDENYYERLVEKAKQYRADIVMSGFTKNIGDIELPNQNEIPIGYYSRPDIEKSIFPLMFYDADAGIPGIFTYVWNKLFRRELLYPNQIAVEKSISIGEDAACVYPTILDANSIYIDRNEGYHYRQRTGSMLKQHAGVKLELNKLKKLYNYLETKLGSKKEYDAKNGIQRFMQYMIASRTGGVFEYNGRVVSVYADTIPSQIIIYGAGNIGQHLYGTIISKSISRINYWIDPDFAIYQKEGLPVDDSDILKNYGGETVLLALLNKTEIQGAMRILEKHKIPRSKIMHLNPTKIDCLKLLS